VIRDAAVAEIAVGHVVKRLAAAGHAQPVDHDHDEPQFSQRLRMPEGIATVGAIRLAERG
jgi:hypothetical protein